MNPIRTRNFGVHPAASFPGRFRPDEVAAPGHDGPHPVGVKGDMGPLLEADEDGMGAHAVEEGAEDNRLVSRNQQSRPADHQSRRGGHPLARAR